MSALFACIRDMFERASHTRLDELCREPERCLYQASGARNLSSLFQRPRVLTLGKEKNSNGAQELECMKPNSPFIPESSYSSINLDDSQQTRLPEMTRLPEKLSVSSQKRCSAMHSKASGRRSPKVVAARSPGIKASPRRSVQVRSVEKGAFSDRGVDNDACLRRAQISSPCKSQIREVIINFEKECCKLLDLLRPTMTSRQRVRYPSLLVIFMSFRGVVADFVLQIYNNAQDVRKVTSLWSSFHGQPEEKSENMRSQCYDAVLREQWRLEKENEAVENWYKHVTASHQQLQDLTAENISRTRCPRSPATAKCKKLARQRTGKMNIQTPKCLFLYLVFCGLRKVLNYLTSIASRSLVKWPEPPNQLP